MFVQGQILPGMSTAMIHLSRTFFFIHGYVDGFSRRVLWLQVQWSNKKLKIIARYFYDYVKATGGCPINLLTDHGTENGLIAAMQCYLRVKSSSVSNQVLETKEFNAIGLH